MSEKKNIDRLFQEKFKDFEAAPPEYVWENIEAELKEDKKRRVIPIWFKLGGVAAVLLLGLMLINPFGDKEIDIENNSVVDNDKNPNNSTNNKNSKDNDNKKNINSVIDKDHNPNFGTTNAVATGYENNTNDNDAIVIKENTASGTSTTQPNKSSNNNAENNIITKSKTGFTDNKNAVASGYPKNTDRSDKTTNNPEATDNITGQNTPNTNYNKNTIAATNKTNNNSNSTNSNNNEEGNKLYNTNTTGIAEAQNKKKESTSNNNNVENNKAVANNTVKSTQKEANPLIDKDITLEEALAETPVDTTTVVPEQNELEKLLEEKLKEEKNKDKQLAEESAKQKWNIKPQVAPVFYNSLSQGSPIDADLAGNSKDYDNDLSYGIGVDYAINDRVSIRSGINSVNLSYSTQGVEFFPSMTQQTNNISASSGLARTANLVVQNPSSSSSISPDFESQQRFSGSMLQEMGYIEVPLEMSYALVNKKFGINVIGGFSTLFLNENNVSVITTQGLSSTIGEAENLNNIHFSTNVGIGFKYRFFKSFQASFEPTFKYQINTFSGGSGNFKPYFIGLYSGISFSF
ncbi:hypothetical protein [uncultured Flavobacterium sp.]|uniref:hypothetical protein n=1 Tax=uncultured Flavobacterium sp. TaxID=165435 RepID=UPI0025EE2DB5|nr:hypothetical protein [uncultured Flavobacterium sp.]